jgi:cytochrome b561
MTAISSERTHPDRYSLTQILLHWSIAALVVWQLVFGDSIGQAERLARGGGEVSAATQFLASSHVWVGFAILALVTLRIFVRLRNGAPPPAGDGSPLAAGIARAAHGLFYALLFAMPITGILDYYFHLPTGGIHELGKPVFIVLIAVHAAAALWHQFVRRDGTLGRMLAPAR